MPWQLGLRARELLLVAWLLLVIAVVVVVVLAIVNVVVIVVVVVVVVVAAATAAAIAYCGGSTLLAQLSLLHRHHLRLLLLLRHGVVLRLITRVRRRTATNSGGASRLGRSSADGSGAVGRHHLCPLTLRCAPEAKLLRGGLRIARQRTARRRLELLFLLLLLRLALLRLLLFLIAGDWRGRRIGGRLGWPWLVVLHLDNLVVVVVVIWSRLVLVGRWILRLRVLGGWLRLAYARRCAPWPGMSVRGLLRLRVSVEALPFLAGRAERRR